MIDRLPKTSLFMAAFSLVFLGLLISCQAHIPGMKIEWKTIQGGVSEVTLRWDANTEAHLAGYKIYYSIGSPGPPFNGTGLAEGDSPILIPLKGLNNPENPEFRIHGLNKTETYFFVITAYNTRDKESGYSKGISIIPP